MSEQYATKSDKLVITIHAVYCALLIFILIVVIVTGVQNRRLAWRIGQLEVEMQQLKGERK